MHVHAKSRKVGHPIKELGAFWTIYEKGWSSEGWVFLAPTIKKAAPTLLSQKSLFGDDFDENDTAFEFLQDALNVVRAGTEDSERYDADLLTDFVMAGAASKGVTIIQLKGVSRSVVQPADFELRESASSLLIRIPDPQLVRLVGKLDMVRSSNSNFELLLADGERFNGVWQGEDADTLGKYWSQEVAIDGMMVYKPNGRPLRLEGRTIRTPEARDHSFAPTSLNRQQGKLDIPKSALTIGQLRGSWPSTETDQEIEEFFANVR